MPRYVIALIYGIALWITIFLLGEYLVAWSGGNVHSQIYRLASVTAFFGVLAVYMPRNAAIVGVVLTALAIMSISGSTSGPFFLKRMLVIACSYLMPLGLPFLWSVCRFDRFGLWRQKPI